MKNTLMTSDGVFFYENTDKTIFDKRYQLCCNMGMGAVQNGKAVQSFPRKGVSRMSVIEVLTLLLVITNIITLVVTICNNNKKK